MPKTMLWGALLVATSLLNTQKMYQILSKLDKNWLSYEQNTICPLKRFSIFFHKSFRINVELNFNLKFWSDILS